jgi:hypothetical protein
MNPGPSRYKLNYSLIEPKSRCTVVKNEKKDRI